MKCQGANATCQKKHKHLGKQCFLSLSFWLFGAARFPHRGKKGRHGFEKIALFKLCKHVSFSSVNSVYLAPSTCGFIGMYIYARWGERTQSPKQRNILYTCFPWPACSINKPPKIDRIEIFYRIFFIRNCLVAITPCRPECKFE